MFIEDVKFFGYSPAVLMKESQLARFDRATDRAWFNWHRNRKAWTVDQLKKRVKEWMFGVDLLLRLPMPTTVLPRMLPTEIQALHAGRKFPTPESNFQWLRPDQNIFGPFASQSEEPLSDQQLANEFNQARSKMSLHQQAIKPVSQDEFAELFKQVQDDMAEITHASDIPTGIHSEDTTMTPYRGKITLERTEDRKQFYALYKGINHKVLTLCEPMKRKASVMNNIEAMAYLFDGTQPEIEDNT